jgi:hypothetical protein
MPRSRSTEPRAGPHVCCEPPTGPRLGVGQHCAGRPVRGVRHRRQLAGCDRVPVAHRLAAEPRPGWLAGAGRSAEGAPAQPSGRSRRASSNRTRSRRSLRPVPAARNVDPGSLGPGRPRKRGYVSVFQWRPRAMRIAVCVCSLRCVSPIQPRMWSGRASVMKSLRPANFRSGVPALGTSGSSRACAHSAAKADVAASR